ncbi:hypothetical protein V5O48_013057 [Marasmius crinis-equi]|uniref:C2H2-type domain-containing protein n=1 Tax=Marasmius crinis-equi TaxID=585013 RepID=A0ABR3F1A1_9AGAR
MLNGPVNASSLRLYEGRDTYGSDSLRDNRARPSFSNQVPSLPHTGENWRTIPYEPPFAPEKRLTEFEPDAWNGRTNDEISGHLIPSPSSPVVPLSEEGIRGPISCWTTAKIQPQPETADSTNSTVFGEVVPATENARQNHPQCQSVSPPKKSQACRRVGSRAGTRASLKHRKKLAAYFCDVVGCESKGFTEKHNYHSLQMYKMPPWIHLTIRPK